VAISKNKDKNQERIVCNLIFVLIFKKKKKHTPCFKIISELSENNRLNNKSEMTHYKDIENSAFFFSN
jgi:hypothetical protein